MTAPQSADPPGEREARTPDPQLPPPIEARPASEEEVRERLRARNIRRGVRVFVIIGVVAAAAVIAFTVSGETLEGLGRLKPHWLALTVLLWLVATGVDGARLAVLSRAGEHRIGIVRSAEIILVGYFMAAITPFQVGGLPLQLYSMSKWGISPGKASAMLLARGILFYGMVFAAAPFIAVHLGVSSVLLKVLATYIAIIIAGGAVFVILTLFFPQVVACWRDRLAAKEKPGRVRRLLVRSLGEFGHFADGLKLYFRGRNIWYLLVAALLTVAYGLSYFGMTAAILGGLGVLHSQDVLRVLGINNLLVAVLLYIPTPGAGGVAEAGAAALYAMLCPRYMLGVFVLLWRLFSFYIGAFVGGAVALKHVAR
ncbi:MAG TPA: flippase-like domain-containing protein [candidate division WOR-3 bacterium]|uniref:Flippase-like domain-containing protein n=1 Tax=candidate division WOR-3 bacterium TaxID=2052148 RepID=A0A7V0T7N0_UNCW3|nr:flippase-like domain-containing protein [candidate division WOR-3 bacterium]